MFTSVKPNCTDCSVKNFTSESTYRCTQCDTTLCVYHGQKHEKNNPTHTVERIGSSSTKAPTLGFNFGAPATTTDTGNNWSSYTYVSPFGNHTDPFTSSTFNFSTAPAVPLSTPSIYDTTSEVSLAEADPFWQEKVLEQHIQRSSLRPPKRQFKILLVGDGKFIMIHSHFERCCW